MLRPVNSLLLGTGSMASLLTRSYPLQQSLLLYLPGNTLLRCESYHSRRQTSSSIFDTQVMMTEPAVVVQKIVIGESGLFLATKTAP